MSEQELLNRIEQLEKEVESLRAQLKQSATVVYRPEIPYREYRGQQLREDCERSKEYFPFSPLDVMPPIGIDD